LSVPEFEPEARELRRRVQIPEDDAEPELFPLFPLLPEELVLLFPLLDPEPEFEEELPELPPELELEPEPEEDDPDINDATFGPGNV
jgi:hypothetical protein